MNNKSTSVVLTHLGLVNHLDKLLHGTTALIATLLDQGGVMGP